MNSGSGVTTKSFEISPGTQISHVKLRVHSIERSLLFYEGLLGFKLVRLMKMRYSQRKEGMMEVI